MKQLTHLQQIELERQRQVWDSQVRLFAKYFLAHVNLPKIKFSLLDVGCGTGSALSEIKKCYPLANLFGCDMAEEHVALSRKKNGEVAQFFQGTIESIDGFFDILYVSNVLEHVPDWKAALEHMIRHSNQVYVLVPYREEINRKPLSELTTDDHIHSFDEKSFLWLKNSSDIQMRVIRTPYAWGHPLRREIILKIKSVFAGRHMNVQRELLVLINKKERVRGNLFQNKSAKLKPKLIAMLDYFVI